MARAPDAKNVEAVTWLVFGRALTITGVTYVDAIAAIHTAGRKFATFLRRYDVILPATLPAPPLSLAISICTAMWKLAVINKRVSEYLSIHAAARCRWLASSANNIVLPSLAAWSARVHMLNLELRFARIVTTGNNSI